MKKLHLIRHAKSSWNNSALADIDRPLNQRGLHACALMAEQISKAGCSFEHIFCSPAVRAQSTIEKITQHLSELSAANGGHARPENHHTFVWKTDPALYTFVMKDLLRWCRQLNDSLSDVVIVGHNEAMTDFINTIGNQSIDNLPTCGYAQLSLPIEQWQKVSPGIGDTINLLTPKMFR